MVQLRSASDHARLADEQAALRRVATLVADEAAPDEIFASVAEEIARILTADRCAIGRFEAGDSMTVVAYWSTEEPKVPVGTRIDLRGDDVTAAVRESGRPIVIDDHDAYSGPLIDYARTLGSLPRSTVAAPIFVEGRIWGSIFASTMVVKITDGTESRVVDFAELIATAIANTEARGELERVANEQRALRTAATLAASGAPPSDVFAAITTAASELFEAPFASLLRYGPDDKATMIAGCAACSGFVGQTWTVPEDDSGIVRTVVGSSQPARIEGHSAVRGPLGEAARSLGISSVVGVPVVVDGSVWGVLAVGAAEDGQPLPADATDRLVGFTELVTSTLINAETRDSLRRLADEQAALRRVATLVAAGVEPDELFAAVSEEVAQLLTADGAGVGRFEPDGYVVTVGNSESLRSSFPVGSRQELDKSLISGEVFRTGRAARKDFGGDSVGDVDALGELAREVLAMGFISTVAAPIVVEGELWGLVTASSRQALLPADTEKRLESFSELVATAIANSESRTDLATSELRARELANEQAALRRVATLVAAGVEPNELFSAVSNEIAGLFTADWAAVGRYEPDGAGAVLVGVSIDVPGIAVGTRSGLDKGIVAGEIYRTGRPARNDDVEATGAFAGKAREFVALGFISTVGAPIVVEGELWGYVAASSSRTILPPNSEQRIGSFGELVATAIANAESRAELATSELRARELANEQAALRRVATLVAAGVEPDELFSAVSDEVVRLFGADGAGVGRFEPEHSAVVVVGMSENFGSIPVGSRQALDKSPFAGDVYRTGRTARIEIQRDDDTDAASVGEVARQLLDLGFTCAAAAPIAVEGQLWGVLTVLDSRASLPADAERRVESFAELVATAIANSESRTELAASEARARELANEQAALRRVATLVAAGVESDEVFTAVSEEVARLFKADGAAVGRLEPDGAGIVVVGRSRGLRGIPVGTHADLDESPAGDVRRTRRAVRWSDKFYTSVAAPIMVGGSLWGVLTAGSGGEGFPANTEERLQQFGELVATAIANTESRAALATSEARARELANEQAALRRVATLVAQGATPDELVSAVAEEVAGIIDIPVVGVHRYEPDGTFTILGLAGQTNFTVGSRWPIEEEGIAGQILATGRPARKDDYSAMPGRLGRAVRRDRMVSTVGVPIVVDGSVWGFLGAVSRPGKPIPSDTDAQLARFTELVATAVSNATTRTELLTSRARVVSAADETRRRLERDLHDGIQQWLVALALRARKAAGLSAAGKSPVEELSGLADDLVAVTDELREISRGIHPAILSDAGLNDALAALARRCTVRVDLDISFDGRHDPRLEATVYYVVAESLTNAVKHAHATTVWVHGGARGESIEVEIKDDGVGGASPGRGTGLIGLKDRVDTLGGTISFASPPGVGTTVRVSLPAALPDEERPFLRPSAERASATPSG